MGMWSGLGMGSCPFGTLHGPLLDLCAIMSSRSTYMMWISILEICFITISGNWQGFIRLCLTTLGSILLILIFFLHDQVPDKIVWERTMEGVYSSKAGYKWIIQEHGGSNHTFVWSEIWKLKCPEKIKCLLWSEWHNSTPTLQMLHHRGVTPSSPRCGICEETFNHAVRDCNISREMWKTLGFRDHTFFAPRNSHDWICLGLDSPTSFLFLAGIWGAWCARNRKCLAQEDTHLHKLIREAQHFAATMEICFGSKNQQTRH